MVNKLMYLDGQKAVDLWEGNEGWTILSGDGNETPTQDYYKFIPTLYRAVQLRAGSVGSMPFRIMKGKAEYDSSTNWQNKVGFLLNPTTILQLVEASLVMAGRAYLFRDKSKVAIKKLSYHLPGSVTPKIDPVKGLIGFERPVNSVPKSFAIDDYVYFWPPDPYIEIGPALNFPAQAAANAAGVLLNVDVFAASFMKRGAIKAMLLTVKGTPKESEKTKLRDWWRSVIAGVKNAFAAEIINADAITPVVVGEGLKELENVTLGAEKREDIAIAVGIPMSILFANAANYATSQQDDLNYLTKTIIPECEFIQSILNEQVFEPLGLHWEFLPETLDAMQEDEEQRAQALTAYINAGFPLLMACDVLGIELTDEQRAELEAAVKEKEERAAEMARRLAEKPADPEPISPADDGDEQPPDNELMRSDLAKWQRKSLKALAGGKSAVVPFDSENIPATVVENIAAGLKIAATPEDVRAVFANCQAILIGKAASGEDLVSALVRLANELKAARVLLVAEMKFSDDQPRDDAGRFANGGGGSGTGVTDGDGGKDSKGNAIVGKTDDGSDIILVNDLSDINKRWSGPIAIAVKGNNRGDIIFAEASQESHLRLVQHYDSNDTEENYVRGVWTKNRQEFTFMTSTAASIDEDIGLENIYKALDKLAGVGVPINISVQILEKGKTKIRTTIKMFPMISNIIWSEDDIKAARQLLEKETT